MLFSLSDTVHVDFLSAKWRSQDSSLLSNSDGRLQRTLYGYSEKQQRALEICVFVCVFVQLHAVGVTPPPSMHFICF